MLRSLLRYGGFHARREGGRLHMTFGVIFRTDTLIDSRRVTALELRQTLFMKLFGLHTAAITAAGYGREKGVRPVIVPAAGRKELCGLLDRLLPDFPLHSSCLRPRRTALMSYAAPPLLVCAASLVPLWLGGVGRSIAAIGFAVGLWWLIIRLIGFAQAGFGVGREAVVIRYPRGLALYEVHVPLEVTDCLIVTQNPFQRRTGTCTLEVRCFGEKRPASSRTRAALPAAARPDPSLPVASGRPVIRQTYKNRRLRDQNPPEAPVFLFWFLFKRFS